ncbi:MAG: thioredoxin domain-containing protein [Phycisphaerae bacterium]|jgi:hypothetical protein
MNRTNRLTALTIAVLPLSCGALNVTRAAGDPTSTENAVTGQTEKKNTNRLIHATSPYLLQHADNPVDWYEWGPEAFQKAREEDKPVFLSIGYSACHWCHVMAHESFESDDVAEVLNGAFVSIKVDREERPDIDEIYMAYTQALTRGGGWPMSVWLTPDARPFHAGTYFPKDRFVDLLRGIAQAWSNDRQKILEGAGGAESFFSQWSADPEPAEGVVSRETLDATAKRMVAYFDRRKGGTRSGSNKFPPSMTMDLLLRVHKRTGDAELLDVVETTLDHMARGGIYDHIGGGICRYSTDPDWLVPHFEKMLYDQAMVSSIYLDAYQITKDPLYAFIAADIFDYVIEDLQSPEGGFRSARDADSDGLEGAFYIWTVDEVTKLLGEQEGKLFCAYYDVTQRGNWFESRGHAPDGAKNILHIDTPPEDFARLHDMTADELNTRIQTWRKKLHAARSKRTPPGLDDKCLTAWNGLMIAALAKGARVLNEPEYADAAAKAASFVLEKLRNNGRLLRTYRKGEARLTGYLSDYAFFVDGLLNLYEATFDPKWLADAVALTDKSIEFHFDKQGGAFFFTANDGETLIARSKNPHDGAIPSGNSIHAMNLLRLAVLVDNKDYRTKAESIFRTFGKDIETSPHASERLLCAADFYHDRVKEIAVMGDPTDPATRALLETVYGAYLPNKVVVGAPAPQTEPPIVLLRGRTLKNGKPTAYVCENYRCKLPVTSPDDLVAQLKTH